MVLSQLLEPYNENEALSLKGNLKLELESLISFKPIPQPNTSSTLTSNSQMTVSSFRPIPIIEENVELNTTTTITTTASSGTSRIVCCHINGEWIHA